jgi:hypothetical protein
MIRQANVRRRKHEPYKKSLNSPGTKKGDIFESKVKSMNTIFLTSRRLFSKNSSWQVSQFRILPENVERLRPDLWRQKNWLLHKDNASSHTSFFTMEFFTNSMNVVPIHSTVLFPRLKMNLKGRHFVTIEMIEA